MKQTGWTFCLLRKETRSAGFQTCRIADPPKSAGREAAPEAGLETCAIPAAARRRLELAPRSYLQFELVARRFLPTMNLVGQTRNHRRVFRIKVNIARLEWIVL